MLLGYREVHGWCGTQGLVAAQSCHDFRPSEGQDLEEHRAEGTTSEGWPFLKDATSRRQPPPQQDAQNRDLSLAPDFLTVKPNSNPAVASCPRGPSPRAGYRDEQGAPSLGPPLPTVCWCLQIKYSKVFESNFLVTFYNGLLPP